jgi:thiamine kinase-like enzyme
MNTKALDIIARIPGWADARELKVEPLAGLTNTNYLVKVDGLRFCHNDLFWVNVLDDGRVRFVDWEFVGMGDRYSDLATLVYAYESAGPLPRDLEEYLLECYFGAVRPEHWARLEGMKYMLLFFTAMWGLLQHGLQQAGTVPIIPGFDYLEYANATLGALSEMLQAS